MGRLKSYLCSKTFTRAVLKVVALPSTTIDMMRSKHFRYAQFKSSSTRLNIQALKTKYRWVVEWTSNFERQNTNIDETSVFIGQLNPQEVTEDLLLDKFGQYGEIEEINLIKRNRPPGARKCRHFIFSERSFSVSRPAFAFIKFVEATAAKKAVESEVKSYFQLVQVNFIELSRMARPLYSSRVQRSQP